MKKWMVLPLVAFTMLVGAATATAQTTKAIAEKINVVFPTGTIVEQGEGGPLKMYTLKTADSAGYAAGVMDFEAMGMTEDILAAQLESPEFKEQLKGGMLSQGGEIVSEESGKYKDKYTFFQFRSKSQKDGKDVFAITRMTFYKANMIVQSFKEGTGDNKMIADKFFNSLAIAE